MALSMMSVSAATSGSSVRVVCWGVAICHTLTLI